MRRPPRLTTRDPAGGRETLTLGDIGWLVLLTVCAVTVAVAILFGGIFAMRAVDDLYHPPAPAPAPVVPIPERTRVPDPDTPQTPVDGPGDRSTWAPA